MTDEILFEGGAEITQRRLGEAFARAGWTNFVERGLTVTADTSANVADISSGKLFVERNGRDLTILPDAVAGKPLPSDGTAHIFAHVTESQNQDGSTTLGFEYVVETSDTPPAGPSLKIATVDMSTGDETPLNRESPASDDNATTYKGEDIDTDGDGVVDRADEAALADDVADSATVPASSVSGQVSAAAVADAIASADYGQLAAGDLVHTGGALSSRSVTIEDGASYSIGADSEPAPAIEYDHSTGDVTLGKAGSPLLAAALDADGNDLERVGRATFNGALDDGIVIEPDPEGDKPALIPYLNDSALGGERLYFDLQDRFWRFVANVRFQDETLYAGPINARDAGWVRGAVRDSDPSDPPNGAEWINTNDW